MASIQKRVRSRKRSRTSDVDRRRMSGYSKRFPSNAKVAIFDECFIEVLLTKSKPYCACDSNTDRPQKVKFLLR